LECSFKPTETTDYKQFETMKTQIKIAMRLTLTLMVLFSVVYTFAVWGVAQFSPDKGKGETITQQNRVWHANIGQAFTEDRYFNSRPSANRYNAAQSGGSNKAPSNPEYLDSVKARIDNFLMHNPSIDRSEVPVELVTASGSGLDPDISPSAALVQVKRIAKVRGLSEKMVRDLVFDCLEEPLLGCIGTAKVNVLKLNIALDELSQ
jgi:K+-transporting ATPase ATPase C chain